MQPAVSIIVLNYNGLQDTMACLRSLEHLTYSRASTILVDNASSDGTADVVRGTYPNVMVMETGANLGFTGGNNVAIKYALEHGADYVMLLNNDTIVAPDFLNVMVEGMEQDPTIGVAGPMIYYHNNPETIWTAGGTIDWKHGTTSMIGLNQMDVSQFGLSPTTVDFVSGCALLARRNVWEKVGLLDDKFFMYYEEAEWCVRATRAGFKIALVPMAMIWHKISEEERAASPRTYYYMVRNRLLFLHKTGAGYQTWAFTVFEYIRTFANWTLLEKRHDRRHLRKPMVQAFRDYSRGHFGQLTT
jgi:GT2 family glycosyltransferase